jgi:hypothetical protein
VQYSAVQYSAVQYSAVQCSTVQYSVVQYNTVQCRPTSHPTLQALCVNEFKGLTFIWEWKGDTLRVDGLGTLFFSSFGLVMAGVWGASSVELASSSLHKPVTRLLMF